MKASIIKQKISDLENLPETEMSQKLKKALEQKLAALEGKQVNK